MSIRISKVYTRGGDKGLTSLVGGMRISKGALKLETYGSLDELLCHVGMARTLLNRADGGIPDPERAELETLFRRLQNELFDVGSLLATPPGQSYEGMPVIRDDQITFLEESMDKMQADLPVLDSFVLPGGTPLNAALHQCRAVTRRVERVMTRLADEEELFPNTLKYINRLSDFFFVLARHVARLSGSPEYLWETGLGNRQSKPSSPNKESDTDA